MVNNTTELLSIIVKSMSKEGIELTSVELYEQAVEINNKVKVYITENGYLVYEANKDGRFKYWYSENMTRKVIDLLNINHWLPGDDIEAYGEWFTLVVEESSYYAEKNQYQVYRLLDENYSLSERMHLEDLKNNYTNVSLENRLK